uniref:Uncharacterized protein n=1 Tax=Trichuris muris TaxID=70415 RepID=A0A5S6QAD8_TRIMR
MLRKVSGAPAKLVGNCQPIRFPFWGLLEATGPAALSWQADRTLAAQLVRVSSSPSRIVLLLSSTTGTREGTLRFAAVKPARTWTKEYVCLSAMVRVARRRNRYARICVAPNRYLKEAR